MKESEQITMPLGSPEDILNLALDLKEKDKHLKNIDAVKAAMRESGKTPEDDVAIYTHLLLNMKGAAKARKAAEFPEKGIETEDTY